MWRSDPTPVRALEHQEAPWMLLARTTHVGQKDGVHHNSEIYFADELWGMAGEEVEVAHMPHNRRRIEIFHEGRWLATAYPSTELDEDARVRAPQQRREDEKTLSPWARRARRRASAAAAVRTLARIAELDGPPAARQVALAKFDPYGFEAAAITTFAVASAAFAPPTEVRIERVARLRFDHPFAAIAVAGKPAWAASRSRFRGLPLFTAWIDTPTEAE